LPLLADPLFSPHGEDIRIHVSTLSGSQTPETLFPLPPALFSLRTGERLPLMEITMKSFSPFPFCRAPFSPPLLFTEEEGVSY